MHSHKLYHELYHLEFVLLHSFPTSSVIMFIKYAREITTYVFVFGADLLANILFIVLDLVTKI